MLDALSRQWFLLIEALYYGVWLRSRSHSTGKGMVDEYRPLLDDKLDGMHDSIEDLRLLYRTPENERWPQEVNDRLRTLSYAINAIGLSEDKGQELLRTRNALVELQSAQETIERYGFPESTLLTEIQVDLVRTRNQLDPSQGQGHHL
jgi:hypothetical protein